MKIYTIIVTYNGLQWMDFCLGSLRASTVQTTPIIIDNNSSDKTVEYIRANYPECVILDNNKNLGFGRANNMGLSYALKNNADYVLLLNQDAAIAPNMLELCLSQSDGKSLLSPIHMNGDGTRVDNSFRYNSLVKCDAFINDIITGNIKNSYHCGEICAACWLLPISILQSVGGFSPLFFQYCEDNNYYNRLIYHGIKTILVPNARVYHDRLDFGNEAVYNQQWLYGVLLLNFTNLNTTSSQKIWECLRILWQCYRTKLPPKKYNIGAYLYSIVKLLANTKTIKYYRSIEKHTNSSHL